MNHRIISFNVNGSKARQDAILAVWRDLEPTILCLQETKCRADIFWRRRICTISE